MRRVFALGIVLIAFAGCLIWWTTGGREFVQKAVHPFRVTHVDNSAGTMSLVHGNRSYIVRCDTHCSEFRAQRNYPMKDAGAVLEYGAAGQKLAFPIIEEETIFDVTGGRG